jgi:hypothetical protein
VRACGGGLYPSATAPLCISPAPPPADLKPRYSEPFSELIYLFVRIPSIATLFPERLEGLSGQSGGTTGGRSARMGTNGQIQGEA